MIPALSLVLLLAPPAVPEGVVDFGAGHLKVPSGCVHVPRLVAVRQQASFYITLKDPTDATWLLAVALAYRPR